MLSLCPHGASGNQVKDAQHSKAALERKAQRVFIGEQLAGMGRAQSDNVDVG